MLKPAGVRKVKQLAAPPATDALGLGSLGAALQRKFSKAHGADDSDTFMSLLRQVPFHHRIRVPNPHRSLAVAIVRDGQTRLVCKWTRDVHCILTGECEESKRHRRRKHGHLDMNVRILNL